MHTTTCSTCRPISVMLQARYSETKKTKKNQPKWQSMEKFSVKEDWKQYIERLGHYFFTNELTDADKQKAILLTVVGAETYNLLHNFCPRLARGQIIIL